MIKADEIEYNSLSRERKKEVDLDIILAISGYTNVNIPIFIDNAEGLKNTADIEKQTIVLTRSDEDKLYVR